MLSKEYLLDFKVSARKEEAENTKMMVPIRQREKGLNQALREEKNLKKAEAGLVQYQESVSETLPWFITGGAPMGEFTSLI